MSKASPAFENTPKEPRVLLVKHRAAKTLLEMRIMAAISQYDLTGRYLKKAPDLGTAAGWMEQEIGIIYDTYKNSRTLNAPRFEWKDDMWYFHMYNSYTDKQHTLCRLERIVHTQKDVS